MRAHEDVDDIVAYSQRNWEDAPMSEPLRIKSQERQVVFAFRILWYNITITK